ncbi:hypothetical protein ABFA07_015864 [Porites harrisoni]
MKWFTLLFLVNAVFCADHNPDENEGVNDPNLFEGDMILTPEQRYRAEHGMDVNFGDNRKRGARKGGGLWPNGVVVYEIAPDLARSSTAINAIKAGMNEWTRKTCISFKKRNGEGSFVRFQNGAQNQCSSQVGRTGRAQAITLGARCWVKGIVVHEIGHAVGFFHEQSRPDRDDFVTILWNNIEQDKKHNFNKYARSQIDSLGSPYDYGSVMHYSSKAFSRNGGVTIQPKQRGAQIGQRRGLSNIDAKQANLLYQCSGRRGNSNRRPGGQQRGRGGRPGGRRGGGRPRGRRGGGRPRGRRGGGRPGGRRGGGRPRGRRRGGGRPRRGGRGGGRPRVGRRGKGRPRGGRRGGRPRPRKGRRGGRPRGPRGGGRPRRGRRGGRPRRGRRGGRQGRGRRGGRRPGRRPRG